MVTWPSFIASSNADCVLGVVRLISSASRKLVKTGPCLNSNAPLVGVVDGDAEHVARQHVAGELEPVEIAVDGAGQRLRERGFADAGDVFDEQVAAREQADHRRAHDVRLAADHVAEGGFQAREPFGDGVRRHYGRGRLRIPLGHYDHHTTAGNLVPLWRWRGDVF